MLMPRTPTHRTDSERLMSSLGLRAPARGEVRPLHEVPDEVFAGGHLGPGLAVEPEDGLFIAPISGTVQIPRGMHHAFYLDGDDGRQVLVQIGVGAHALRGLGFTRMVHDGQRVQAGEPLCQVDLECLRIASLPTISAVVLTREP